MGHRRAFITVVSANHAAYAVALMGRLKQFDPAVARFIFFVDDPAPVTKLCDGVAEIVPPGAFLANGWYPAMAFRYDAFELCNAVRPAAHKFMLRVLACDEWVYLDADVVPVSALSPIFDMEERASVVATPHLVTPDVRPLGAQSDLNFLRLGGLNSGFLLVRRTSSAAGFVDWFERRCEEYCFNQHMGAFVDQLWLSFAYTVFADMELLRHPGANIAYWNLHERPVGVGNGGALAVDGEAVLFLHLSGWDPDAPTLLSRYAAGVLVPEAVEPVVDCYARELRSYGLADVAGLPYGWDNYADGRKIALCERRRFDAMWRARTWPDRLDPFAAAALLSGWRGARLERFLRRALRRLGLR
jgi:hypothetical protein